LDKAQIATKCVEVSKSLINTQVGLHSYDLVITRKIGDAARFAATIRRSGSIESEKLIAAICDTLKIDFRIISSELIPMFEENDWISTVYDGKRIKRIDENLPPMDDVLTTLGEKWEYEEPEEIERGTIYSLSEVSTRPTEKIELMDKIGIGHDAIQPILEYGSQASYLGTFLSDDRQNEVVWSPLYWNNKPEKVLSYLRKQDDKQFAGLGNLARSITCEPGLPRSHIQNCNESLLDTGIHFGFFSDVQITDNMGRKFEYIFPPSSSFALEPDKDIFEKARMIVACIRHGQYNAEISKILYPLSILRAMRTDLMKPHPYALVQYAILMLHGLIKITPAKTRFGEAYKVTWIDSPENNLAAEMAAQLLKGEAIYQHTHQEIEAKKVLVEGLYDYSTEQRRIKTARSIAATTHYERLMKDLVGARV
jgi:hypothetical protein